MPTRVADSPGTPTPHEVITGLPDAVATRLREFFDSRHALVAAIGDPYAEAVRALEDFTLNGGKRIRPTCVMMGFLAGGGLHHHGPDTPELEEVITVAAAIELIQSCALIHDDIIDASETRRGETTVHRRFAAQHAAHGWRGNSDHFGESIGIITGDLALAWADDMFVSAALPATVFRRTYEHWAAMRTEVLGGQLLDVAIEARADENIDHAWKVVRFKTAAYTTERPLLLGASLAGADATLLDALSTYGRDIGLAFQLRDDVLGIYGDPSVTGKPAGDDLREGKRTVLLGQALAALDRHNPEQAHLIRTHIGTTDDPAIITQLAEAITASGAVDAIETEIDRLVASATEAITSAHLSPEVTALFTQLTQRTTQRKY